MFTTTQIKQRVNRQPPRHPQLVDLHIKIANGLDGMVRIKAAGLYPICNDLSDGFIARYKINLAVCFAQSYD